MFLQLTNSNLIICMNLSLILRQFLNLLDNHLYQKFLFLFEHAESKQSIEDLICFHQSNEGFKWRAESFSLIGAI